MLGTFFKRIFGATPPAETFRLGKAAYESGALDDAARLLASAVEAEPHNAEAHLYAGLTAYRQAQYESALRNFERAIELDPQHSDYRYQAGAAEYALGNSERAWKRCEEAIARNPDSPHPNVLMSYISLPGPPYTWVLQAVHDTLRPRTYFEIGVSHGKSIQLTRPETRAVGVDPEPRVDVPLPANITVHATTSDDYFAQRNVEEDLGGQRIELAFIDGLHHFDAALRDFINVERHCTPESTVLVHDWFPLNRRTAERDRPGEGTFYSGDVWRLALVLKKYRPDLEISTIATPPTGLGMIRRLDPASTVLADNYTAIVAEFMALDYDVLDADKAGTLNLVPNDWKKMRELLGNPAAGAP